MAETSVYQVDLDSGDIAEGGQLDDLAITGDHISMLRIERMDSNYCWGRIYMKDGPDILLGWVVDKRSLKMDVRHD